jgi:hypothetical protein
MFLSITARRRQLPLAEIAGFRDDPLENARCWTNHIGARNLACFRFLGRDVGNAKAA